MAYLDSRQLQERLDELEGEEYALTEEEASELAELRELADEVSEWHHGTALIPEDEFEDYARELADELAIVPSNMDWPFNCIDWKEAADQLRQDYNEVTYQGTTYLVRSF